MSKDLMIKARSKISGSPRPELGLLTEGAEYLVPEGLFDEEIFDPVLEEKDVDGVNKKQKKGGK